MQTRDQLEAAIQAGQTFSYLFFWGHSVAKNGGVGKSCFSQWYPAEFSDAQHRYATAEHYMMAQKAALFGDTAVMQQILAATTPKQAKSLGRKVTGFDEQRWLEQRFAIVVEGNWLKFSQNPELAAFLRSTGDSVLVEASPVDTIWGIGLAHDAPEAQNPSQWRGENLLGFALMQVRERLAS
jgi:ribA/ribD-fused uncharacterized protein